MSIRNNKKRYDPLLECLVTFSNLYHKTVSIGALISGFPIEPGKSGPELFSLSHSKGLFSRIAQRAGYRTRLIETDLNHFSPLLLPAILVLKSKKACILEEVDLINKKAKIVLPEVPNSELWLDIAELNKEYLGYAFLLKKEYKYKKRRDKLIESKEGHWFWDTIEKSKNIYLTVIIASLLINIFVLATPLFIMNVYDRVIPNNAIDTLWVLVVGMFLVFMFDGILKFIRNYLLEIAGKKSDVIMSSLIFEHVLNMRYENWPSRVGSFANNIREFESIRSFLTSATVVALVDLPFAFIFLMVIGYISGPLVVIPLVTSALIIIYSIVIKAPLRDSIESTFEASANKNSHLIESLNMIQTIKALDSAHASQWIWEESTGEIATKSMKSRLLSSSMTVVTGLFLQFNSVAIVILGVYMITDLTLSMGGLIAIVMLSSRVVAPMGQVAGLIANFQQTKTAYESINNIMNTEIERPKGKDFVVKESLKGDIKLKNMGFTYPDAEKESLKNVNINIKAGEKVGIIGKVGSGKTTLAKLIVGLYKPTEGSILYDSIEATQMDPANIREFVSYLSQDVELFQGSIKDNITLKEPGVGNELLLQAAKVGGVDSFVNDLEQGFETQVGERGLHLSGGQRQAIAIARTVLLEEPIMLMDEPTNSFDNSTEYLIRKSLYDFTRDKTFILITHKAPMLDLVDRLIVVDSGRVIMDGSKGKVLDTLKGV